MLERLCLWLLAHGSEIVLSYFGAGLSAPALAEQSHSGPFYCPPNRDVHQGPSTGGQEGQMHTDSKTCFIHGTSQQITSMIWHFICLLKHSCRQQGELCFPLLSPSVTSKVRGERDYYGSFQQEFLAQVSLLVRLVSVGRSGSTICDGRIWWGCSVRSWCLFLHIYSGLMSAWQFMAFTVQ